MPLHRAHFLLAVSLCVTIGGCATERPFVWVADLPNTALQNESVVRPRDTLAVVVRDQAAMTGEFVVREDGGVLLPTIGEVAVGGRTPSQIAAELQTRLASMLAKPEVTVSITQTAPIRVHVVGEVRTPSSYELTRDRSVTAALAAAGWLTEFADRDRIFVVRHDSDGRVRFRARDITAPNPAVARFRLNDGDIVVVE